MQVEDCLDYIEEEKVPDEYAFAKAADWYVKHVGRVEPGIDFENKKFVLRRLFELSGQTDEKLLEHAYLCLEEKVKK